MLYSEKVMDHFKNPRNVGEIKNADGIGEVGNAKCGDIMRMYIKVKNNIITDVKFMTFGCGSAIATSSMATELIKGKPLDKALEITNQAVVEALDGLPAYKLHCSVLAEEAIKAAIKDYYIKHKIPFDEKKYCAGDCACLHEQEQASKTKTDIKNKTKSATKNKTKKVANKETKNTTSNKTKNIAKTENTIKTNAKTKSTAKNETKKAATKEIKTTKSQNKNVENLKKSTTKKSNKK